MDAPERRCGTCGAFTRPRGDAARGLVGDCALEVFPPPVSASSLCSRYREKGGQAPPRAARVAGEPRRAREHAEAPTRAPAAPKVTSPTRPPLPQEIELDMDIDDFRKVLREVLADELGRSEVALAPKWEGGEVVLRPGKPGLQEKRMPLDALFHKIVMIRDKLRVLEQRLNAHEGLSDAEKVQLQQYVTACYGSLTTFNVLFADRDDGFAGAARDD